MNGRESQQEGTKIRESERIPRYVCVCLLSRRLFSRSRFLLFFVVVTDLRAFAVVFRCVHVAEYGKFNGKESNAILSGRHQDWFVETIGISIARPLQIRFTTKVYGKRIFSVPLSLSLVRLLSHQQLFAIVCIILRNLFVSRKHRKLVAYLFV